jgi:tetratricopeptide (TPR) repeat protein
VRTLFQKALICAALAAITVSGVLAQAQRNWKDRAEYDLYAGITQAIQGNDGKKALDLLKEWTEKYPQSDYADNRPTLKLNAYKAANDPRGMLSAADEIIAASPTDLTANYWVCTLMVSNPQPSPEELARAAKSGEVLSQLARPAELPEANWPAVQKEMHSLGYKCSGYVAMQRKENEKAESAFISSLKLKAEDAQINSMLGNVILAQKNPAKQSEALFHYARAASYTGTGALPDAARQQLETFFTTAYNRYHGEDPAGLQELRTLAKSQPLPPAGFKVLSEAEKLAAADEKLKTEQPQLYFWLRLKDALSAASGPGYFEGSMKDALVPQPEQAPLKGTVLESNRKMAKLALSDATTHEVTLMFDPVLKADLAAGSVVEFWGIAQKLTREPFVVEFLIDGENSKYKVAN